MKNLLYLDDSKTSVHLVERFLEGLVKVLGVHTIPEAIKAVEEQEVDVILLDYQLGNRTSFEFADYVRQKSKKNSQTPIILLTAFRGDGIFYRGSKKGINDFISKPVEKNALREIVQLHLDNPKHFREIKPKYLSAQCISWRVGSKYFQFSPDLGLTIEGATLEEVGKKMQKALSQKSKSILAEIEIVLHNVPFEPAE